MTWQRGQSGNPGGRRKQNGDLRDLAREHTGDAVKTLVSIMNDAGQPGPARVSAASAILDRGYGKPMQHNTLEAAIVPFEEILKSLA